MSPECGRMQLVQEAGARPTIFPGYLVAMVGSGPRPGIGVVCIAPICKLE
jgi:hypothetical protein